MRLPRVRVRTLMIAVAVAGIAAAFWRRAEGFRELHRHHLARYQSLLIDAEGGGHSGGEGVRQRWYHPPGVEEFTEREYAVLDWHMGLAKKYGQAASRPWLPVPPDPPPP